MKNLLTTLFLLCACAQAQAQIVGTLPFQLQNGTTADATQVMADFNKILNDVNINAAKNGVNTDITALNALVTPITPVQGGTTIYYASTSGGTANAQTVASPTPSGFTLAVGKRVTFIAGFTNTGAMTLNVNGTGATNVFKPTPSGPIALTGGEVVTNNYIEAVYDGTRYQLYTDSTKQAIGPLTALASAATTDLGTVSSHNVSITGTTGITSFGSTASTGWPFYKISFTGALSITHNGTSLILPGAVGITTAANDVAEVMYLGSGNWRMTSYTRASGVYPANPVSFRGYIDGFIMSVSSPTVISVAPGAANDLTNASVMNLFAANTKTTASWAVGSGNGGLDTGAIANNTWYHWYVIQRPDTGVVDLIFSTNPALPSLPANYTLFRRIGSTLTNGSAQWTPFTQTGDTFVWSTVFSDIVSTSVGTTRATVTLTVPTGVVVEALYRGSIANGAGGGNAILFTSLQESDQVPGSGSFAELSAVTSGVQSAPVRTLTNTSSQIGVRGAVATGTYSIRTYGWIDVRGKQ